MKKAFSMIFIIIFLLALTACSSKIDKSDYQIAVAAYAEDELFNQFTLGIIDEAEKLGYDNVELIKNASDDVLSNWSGHVSPNNTYICLLARDPSVLGICEELKSKGYNLSVAFDDLLLYHEDFPVALKDDEISPAIDCLLPYDEAALYRDIADELKEKLNSKSGRLITLSDRSSGALYDANYYEMCMKKALSDTNCDISNLQFTSLVITNTDDGLIWTPIQDENGNAPNDLDEIQSDTIAVLSFGKNAVEFAGKHFPDKYNVAFAGLSKATAQLYENGAIDSLYYYPVYDLGSKMISHIDMLVKNEHEKKVEYVAVNKFDNSKDEKVLFERCDS